jgi:copper transport protein
VRPLLRLLPLSWLLLAWLLPGEAWAHASLIAAEPEDGSVVQQAPSALVLRFDEVVQPIRISVIGPQGALATAPAGVAESAVLRLPLPPGLPHGTYLASWRVISADGHPIAGTIAFGIGAAPVAMPRHEAADGAWPAALGVLRFALYCALAFAAGGALFRALVEEPSPRLRRWMCAAAISGVPVCLLTIGVQGGAMLGGSFPHALAERTTWQTALGATVADRAVVVMLGLLITAIAVRAEHPAACRMGAAGALVAVAGLGLSGHAAAGGWSMQLLLVAHALAACFWIGALAPLLVLLGSGGPPPVEAIRRFSRIALPAVALLLLSGVVQALRHLPDLASLLVTRYGQLLLAKAALAALLLGLAGLNRLRLTPALESGRGGAGSALRRSIVAELVLCVTVLGVTAALTMTNPHAHHAATADEHDHAGHMLAGSLVEVRQDGLLLTLRVDPARVGTNRLVLTLARADGSPLAAPEVWVELMHAEAGVAGIRRRLHDAGPGQYAHQGPELVVPGRWTAHVDVLLSDFDQRTIALEFDVGAAP